MLVLKIVCSALAPAALCLATSLAFAEPPLTPAQALSSTRAGDLHFSPDGSKIAYVATSYRWDAKPHIRMIEVATGSEQDLTPLGKSDRAPQWAPDGRALGFISNRSGKSQVFQAPAGGGDATALTCNKAGVERFRWSPDSQKLAYVAKGDDAPSADGPQVADDPRGLSRLWILDLASKTTRQLGPSNWRIDDFQWRDATHILVVATPTPRNEGATDAVYGLSTDDGNATLVQTPPQPFDSLTVSPDGKQYALRSTLAKGPEPRDLLLGSVTVGALKPLWPEATLGVSQIRWRDPQTIWARVSDGFYNRIVRFPLNGKPDRIELPLSVNSFDVDANGDLAFVGENFEHLPEVFIRHKQGDIHQLTNLRKGWDGVRLSPTTVFWTKSFDGTAIEAALVKPVQTSTGPKSPLVLLVHGGPASNFTAGYGWEAAWAQMLAAHGYQVLMVNPRGSGGYSEGFLQANRQDWGGGDYRDLMTVLDAVIAKGEVDPNRLGIGGWSYGGEMTAWAITQSHRFKAAVAGAPVFDQQAEYETEADGGSDEWWLGTPWGNPDVYARNSPATYIKAASTPTLILDGEDDVNNPVGQSKGLYRDLKHLGVETTLVTYPGEGHSPRLGSNNTDMFQRILDWYDQHLGSAKTAVAAR